MFSWLTGSKLVENPSENVDDTCLEPPETPAPVFAVRAMKHAIWGTPQALTTVDSTRLSKKRKAPGKTEAKCTTDFGALGDTNMSNYSPTKAGILMTPGTVRGKKKEVTFGAQVVDNENKRPSRSGLPHDFPGKFPSPWTPKLTEKSGAQFPKNNLNNALYEAKATGTTLRRQKGRAKDDADITIDIMEPRSESGRHWKEQYLMYQKQSEEHINKLTAKYKLCKEHAKKKDEEANEFKRQLESISKRHRAREKELEKQIKELREQLRLQMAENMKTSTEISVLRSKTGDVTAKPSTEKLKQALLKLEASDDALVRVNERPEDEEEDHAMTRAYLQAAVVQTRGEHARHSRGNKEWRLACKTESVARQDSVVTPSSHFEMGVSDLEQSPTPRPSADARKPLRRILADMSPNIPSSPPMPSFFSESDHERIMAQISKPSNDIKHGVPNGHSPTHREAMAEAAASLAHHHDIGNLEDIAPMSKLSLQTQRPVTTRKHTAMPKGSLDIPNGKHKRSDAASAIAVSTGLSEVRAKAAQARLEARRAKRHSRLR
ncbi:uncharacterized protein PV09_00005 [Verruconis gallopava]|uniref:Spindle pole body-associated protein cut12 domain-containing protein n=1 Tax=Verruconis gallopava TaxID=253628 RepID=A0A0D1Y1Z6_9PEZI|nr:uncharacterized protein PV09_00005 [Verruconis gallopava]KIW09056.1 hypothetical protein PV09_00005 [Verruconis gallopava]